MMVAVTVTSTTLMMMEMVGDNKAVMMTIVIGLDAFFQAHDEMGMCREDRIFSPFV